MGERRPPDAATSPPLAEAGRPAPPPCMRHASNAFKNPGDFTSEARPISVRARFRAAPADISRTSGRSDFNRRNTAGSTPGAVARTLAEAACAAMLPTADAACATRDADADAEAAAAADSAAPAVGTLRAATSAGSIPSLDTTRAAMAGTRVSSATAAAAGIALSAARCPAVPTPLPATATAPNKLVNPPSTPSATHTASYG